MPMSYGILSSLIIHCCFTATVEFQDILGEMFLDDGKHIPQKGLGRPGSLQCNLTDGFFVVFEWRFRHGCEGVDECG